MIEVTINGELTQLERPMGVKVLLKQLGIDPKKVALEHNLEIVPKSTYGDIVVNDGDMLEIVHFIGGGSDNLEIRRAER